MTEQINPSVDEILKEVNDKLPSDEEIVQTYTSSRYLTRINTEIAMVYEAISLLELSKARNAKLYRRKKRLEFYYQQLQKRAQKVNADRERDNLKKQAKNKASQEVLEIISKGLISHVVRSNQIKIAQDRMLDLKLVKQDLQISLKEQEKNEAFSLKVDKLMKEGYTLKEAVAAIEKEENGPKYRMPNFEGFGGQNLSSSSPEDFLNKTDEIIEKEEIKENQKSNIRHKEDLSDLDTGD